MSAPALTLPGDIEGLLRKCSPVVLEHWTGDIRTGVVVDTPAGPEVAVHPNSSSWSAMSTDNKGVALDLRDATGRAHAAWWAIEAGATALTYALTVLATPGLEASPQKRLGVWYYLKNSCLYLTNLDPEDPRLLEDGSRWVDAEALRLVVLHVAKRAAPEPESR